jgi:ribosomal-protein-serine acetyltransferase
MFRLQVTPAVELRQIEQCDAETLWELTDRNRAYLREWLPWVDHAHSVEDTITFIEQITEQLRAGNGPNTSIRLNGAIVGCIGCHKIDWANRSVSIGYWVDQGLQKKGLVTRSTEALTDYLFRELQLHRVVIQCGTGNSKSCAIPQRLGFTREGVAREAEWCGGRWVDLVVWSMLEHDWSSARHAFEQRMVGE